MKANPSNPSALAKVQIYSPRSVFFTITSSFGTGGRPAGKQQKGFGGRWKHRDHTANPPGSSGVASAHEDRQDKSELLTPASFGSPAADDG